MFRLISGSCCLSTLFLFVQINFAHSQNASCLDPILVCQTIDSTYNTTTNTNDNPKYINPAISCIGSGDVRGYWLKLNIGATGGQFAFKIIPENLGADMDWALFITHATPCASFYYDHSLEKACNASGYTGVTGMSDTQIAPTFEPTITVQPFDELYLFVSVFSQDSNFVLDVSESTAVIDCSLANKNPSNAKYKLWPNPAISSVHIQAKSNLKKTICVYSANGKCVLKTRFSAQKHTLHINNLPAGLYMVKIQTKQDVVFKKFVKK